MDGVITILPEPFYSQVVGIWTDLTEACGGRGEFTTPVPHFSWHVANHYDQKQLQLVFAELCPYSRPFQVRTSGGTHADEIETSMMLFIAPKSVDMKKAVADLHDNKRGPLTRDPNKEGTYSPTGIWGDPTKATRAKGKLIVEGMTTAILKEIEVLKNAPDKP